MKDIQGFVQIPNVSSFTPAYELLTSSVLYVRGSLKERTRDVRIGRGLSLSQRAARLKLPLAEEIARDARLTLRDASRTPNTAQLYKSGLNFQIACLRF